VSHRTAKNRSTCVLQYSPENKVQAGIKNLEGVTKYHLKSALQSEMRNENNGFMLKQKINMVLLDSMY
jgi:hypothetical protein